MLLGQSVVWASFKGLRRYKDVFVSILLPLFQCDLISFPFRVNFAEHIT